MLFKKKKIKAFLSILLGIAAFGSISGYAKLLAENLQLSNKKIDTIPQGAGVTCYLIGDTPLRAIDYGAIKYAKENLEKQYAEGKISEKVYKQRIKDINKELEALEFLDHNYNFSSDEQFLEAMNILALDYLTDKISEDQLIKSEEKIFRRAIYVVDYNGYFNLDNRVNNYLNILEELYSTKEITEKLYNRKKAELENRLEKYEEEQAKAEAKRQMYIECMEEKKAASGLYEGQKGRLGNDFLDNKVDSEAFEGKVLEYYENYYKKLDEIIKKYPEEIAGKNFVEDLKREEVCGCFKTEDQKLEKDLTDNKVNKKAYNIRKKLIAQKEQYCKVNYLSYLEDKQILKLLKKRNNGKLKQEKFDKKLLKRLEKLNMEEESKKK